VVRLVQVIANLLSNAVKFTEPSGHIALRVARRGDWVEIRVQDDGQGVALERLEEIFELYAQADPEGAGGLGVGLALVQSLVKMHGGTVCADSRGPGCGATFTVSLPLCRGVSAHPEPHEPARTDPSPGCRVLVVDDNRDVADALRLILTMLKAEVRVAHDGAEAIQICEDWQPTHILMDLGMPGMDGYETARRLRASHPDRAFRLVAISGWFGEQDRQRSRDAGFDEHLVKPVGVVDLKAILSS
jgi:CheY-like chemotaxis protein